MSVCVMDHEVCALPVQDDLAPWPAEAREMMSRLNDSFPPLMERRRIPRRRYRVEAQVVFPSGGEEPVYIYTRDVNPWSLGFITPHALPAYEHVTLHMPNEHGETMRIRCMIRRCKAFAPGWHQGVIDFEREYPEFAG